MGCGSSRFCITRGGDTSHLYTRLSLLNRPSDRALTDSCHSSSTPVLKGKDHQKREKVGKEEACIDEESSTEEDSNDRDNDINSFQSPSFSVYCVPSEFDDENSEGDHNPEEFKEDQKMDVQIYKKVVMA
ncbi:hypothetical protein V6N13_024044 [Hibiscus sabdariffa]|uniref:Uncharacterized protein n=2 Tax=Hibiscus sabdariffa TaxID=183260 RepID=A0ABR1ZX10_9ROSI